MAAVLSSRAMYTPTPPRASKAAQKDIKSAPNGAPDSAAGPLRDFNSCTGVIGTLVFGWILVFAELTALRDVPECDQLVQHGPPLGFRHRCLSDQPCIDFPVRNSEQLLKLVQTGLVKFTDVSISK